MSALPVLIASLEALVDAHARGEPISEALWRDAIGALAQAKGAAHAVAMDHPAGAVRPIADRTGG